MGLWYKKKISYTFLWHFRFSQQCFWGCRVFGVWHCHLV